MPQARTNFELSGLACPSSQDMATRLPRLNCRSRVKQAIPKDVLGFMLFRVWLLHSVICVSKQIFQDQDLRSAIVRLESYQSSNDTRKQHCEKRIHGGRHLGCESPFGTLPWKPQHPPRQPRRSKGDFRCPAQQVGKTSIDKPVAESHKLDSQQHAA